MEVPENAQRTAWLRDAKFGMFIHWGIYAQLAGEWKGTLINRIGEQIMRFCEIPVKEYEEIAKDFNPVKFNAEDWVLIAKNAGMKYIVITAKHHDGFAMYESKCSPYNIVDATPFSRDPMKELAAACKKHGIKLCFYYSHYQDWHHPHGEFRPPLWNGMSREGRNFEIYMKEKALPQVREILTQYGPIGLIWYDTPGDISEEHAHIFADLVHELQPDCLVSPRVGHNLGDYTGFRDNQVPLNADAEVWETCATMNDTWGYKKNDHNWKSAETLIRLLVSIVSRGGNYLLNVGPTAEGIIPQPSVERLLEIGQWLKTNGEAIYGAKGGLLRSDLGWGTFTAKPGRLYVHIYDWPKDGIAFCGLKNKVKKAYLLADKDQKSLVLKQNYDKELDYHKLSVSLPKEAPDKYVSVLVLDIEGTAEIDCTLMQQPNGGITLDGFLAQIHKEDENSKIAVAVNGVVENWMSTGDWLSWDFKVVEPGIFNIRMTTLTEKKSDGEEEGAWEGGHEFTVFADGQDVKFTVKKDQITFPKDLIYWQYITSECGQLVFDKPGIYNLKLKPNCLKTDMGFGPKLKSLSLMPKR